MNGFYQKLKYYKHSSYKSYSSKYFIILKQKKNIQSIYGTRNELQKSDFHDF